jgi:hypothetical protein
MKKNELVALIIIVIAGLFLFSRSRLKPVCSQCGFKMKPFTFPRQFSEWLGISWKCPVCGTVNK